MLENLYSMIVLESLHDLHLGVSRLLKTHLAKSSALDEISSHPKVVLESKSN